MPPSNVDLLTRSHSLVKAKKNAKKNQIEEVAFDENARYEFLTGFRKRKAQKTQAARLRAKERERIQRLQARSERRNELQEQARRNAKLVEKAYGGDVSEDDDTDVDNANGDAASVTSSAETKGKHREEEYEDEEQLATVTVVEEFDPSTLLYPSIPSSSRVENLRNTKSSASRSDLAPETGSDIDSHAAHPSRSRTSGVRSSVVNLGGAKAGGGAITREKATHGKSNAAPTGSASTDGGAKKNKKKFTYEGKAARKATRLKQRARKLEKADRAGGKAGRMQRSKKRK